jgi:hypothetical protein
MQRLIEYALLASILVLGGSLPLARESESGSLEGIVWNGRGPVAMASVQVRNATTGMVMDATANDAGFYLFRNLHAGRYSLWVRAPGHDPVWILDVFVEKGQITRRDVHLERITPKPAG